MVEKLYTEVCARAWHFLYGIKLKTISIMCNIFHTALTLEVKASFIDDHIMKKCDEMCNEKCKVGYTLIV